MAVFALLGAGCADLIGVDDWRPDSSSAAAGGGPGATASTGASTASTGAGGATTYVDAVLADKPVAYWRLGESRGTKAADEMGMFDGTFDPAVMLGVTGGLMSDADNTAIAIPEDGGSVAIGDHLDFAATAPFSLEAWVYQSQLDITYRGIVNKGNLGVPGDREGYSLASSTKDLVFERWELGNGNPDRVASPPLDRGVFSHVVAVFDGKTTMVLYVNGTKFEGRSEPVPLANTGWPLTLGASLDGTHNLNGILDEVAIYDTPLSEDRVQAHYQAAQ